MTAEMLADLTDDEARQLEGAARAFSMRVLLLMNETSCTVDLAYRAVEATAEGDQPIASNHCSHY